MQVRQVVSENEGFPSGSTAPITITDANGATIGVWVGPLTTIFTPPTSCYATTTSGTPGLYVYDYGGDTSLTCWPPMSGSIQISKGSHFSGIFSPGICPSGWTGATTSTSFANVGTRTGSAVICCPTGFNYILPEAQGPQCVQGLAQAQVITNVWQPGGSQFGQYTWDSATDTVDSMTLTAVNSAACSPISVSWEATDTDILRLMGLITSSSTNLTPVTTSSSTTSSPTSSATTGPTQPPNTSTSSLSSGARAGIGIAVVVSFLAIILGIFFFFRRRGKFNGAFRKGEKDSLVPFPPTPQEMYTRDNTHELYTKYSAAELLAKAEKEKSRKELHGETPVLVAELEGSVAGARSHSPAVVEEESWERSEVIGGIGEEEEMRLMLLKERIERIRKEKERLVRIQELEDMEEATTRQIASAAARNGTGRIRELGDMEENMKREILDTELRRRNT